MFYKFYVLNNKIFNVYEEIYKTVMVSVLKTKIFV